MSVKYTVNLREVNSEAIYRAVCVSFDLNKSYLKAGAGSEAVSVEYGSRPITFSEHDRVLLRARGIMKKPLEKNEKPIIPVEKCKSEFFLDPSFDVIIGKAKNGKREVEFSNSNMFASFADLLQNRKDEINELFYADDKGRQPSSLHY